jgi:hypothetical protein
MMDKPNQLISLHPISQPKTAPDNEAILHFDCAAHRIDYTAEFDVAAVAGCALTIRP